MVYIEISIYTLYRKQRNKNNRNEESMIFRFMLDGKKGIEVVSGVSVWDTYGMKTEIILAKSWIQTPKEAYGNRFDEFLTFFWKGVGYITL